jgi:hypothetical protein
MGEKERRTKNEERRTKNEEGRTKNEEGKGGWVRGLRFDLKKSGRLGGTEWNPTILRVIGD